MGNYIEYNEMPAPNAYAKAEETKKADTFSRSLHDSPGGFTTDHRGSTSENKTTTTILAPSDGQQGDILKSARSKHGGPVGQITDDSVVSINGVSATVRSAVKAGLLTKNADGSYSEVSKQAPIQKQKRNRVDPLTSDSRSRMRTLENLIGKQNAQNIEHRIIAAAGRGEGLHGVQKELADLGNIPPEVTKNIVEGIATDLDVKMMRTVVQDTGLTQPQAEVMLDWCYDNLPKAHVSAMFAGALHGDRGAIKVAFEKYRLSSR